MTTIPLGKSGLVALVDDEDAERVLARRWYAYQSDGLRVFAEEHGRRVYLSRLVTDAPAGADVDHRNHDTLDNRRTNLRICTHRQNLLNRRGWKRTAAGSGYKGVYSCDGLWRAFVTVNGHWRWLGTNHATPEAAARAYDRAARELFGEFAWLNFADTPAPVAGQ